MPVKIPAVYWEDVIIPTHLITQHKKISVQEIKHFAATFDPQPYHLDHDAAKESLFGGLCASGWHVCAIMMRLLSDTMEQDSIARECSIFKPNTYFHCVPSMPL